MVDEAAKRAGYDSPLLYHGTKAFGFTRIATAGLEYEYWSPFFATSDENIAFTYSKANSVRDIGNEKARKEESERKLQRKEDLINEVFEMAANSGFVSERYFKEDVWLGHSNPSVLFNRIKDSANSLMYVMQKNPNFAEFKDAYAEEIAGKVVYEVANHCEGDNRYAWFHYVEDNQEVYNKLLELGNAVVDYVSGPGRIATYQFYANLNNIFEMDGKGKNWNRINVSGIIENRKFSNTRTIASWAKDNGYDGVLIKNITDNGGGFAPEAGSGDIYIFFNPESQVKSADPVTYDDAGNIIPLSERFNPENEDIRFQVAEDSEGRTLSAGQMEYFKDSKVVDENGRLKVMYHGTPQGGFTVFKNGLQFFTESKDYADTYQSPSATSRTAGKTASNPQTYSVYLNIKKPFDIRDAETRRIFVDEYVKGGWALGINPYEEYKDQTTSGLPSWEEADNIYEFLEENDMLDQYDGIIIDEGGIPGQNGETISRGIAYVTFYPEQAKDITNENPTSDPDIRFQLASPVEQVRDLIAVHNLREKELMGSIQLGGFPMPSIAVTKADMGHDNYGDITLMFHSDTIDPQRSRDNQVFGGDAWTPTFPQIDKKISEKAADRVKNKLLGIFGVGSPEEFQSFAKGLRFPSLDPDNLLDKLRSADSPYQAFMDDITFRYAYLMENGITFVLPLEESKLYGEDEAFWMNLSKEIPNALEAKNGDVMPYEPIIRKVIKDAHAGGRLSDSKLPAHLREKLLSMYDKELPFSKVDSYLYNLVQYQRNGMPSILDESATRERLNELVDTAGYEAWVNSLFDGIIEKEGIRNEKDLFTPSGNRRSWEALHDEINLNNIVKAMRQGLQKGAGIFGASDPIGAATREYRSIDEIREDSDRLRTISEEEYKAIKDELIDRFHDIAERFAGNKKGFGTVLDAGSVITEDIANSKTKESLKRRLQQEEQYGYMYSDLLLDDLWELISDMRSMPTGYFEAKPRRAVGFDEVKAAIVPSNISDELRDAMDGAGINYVEYEAGNEEDRLAKVNQQADEQDLRFQISDDLDAELQEVLDGTFDSENNEVYVGTSSNFLTTVIGAKPFDVLMPAKKAYAAMVTEEEAIDDNRYDENINYHGLGKEGLVNALTSSEEPVAAYVSKDEEGTNGKHRNNRIVLVTDQTDDNGNTIVVVEEVNSRGRVNGKRIDANKTITAYGKNYIEGQIRDAIATDTLLYLDEKRISVLTGGTGFQLPGGREDTYFKNNINNFWANVNYKKYGGKMSTGKTEDDTIARKFAEAQAKKDIRRQLRTEEEERILDLQKKVDRLQRDKRRTYGREAKDSDAARVARAILKDTSSDFSLNKTIAGVKKVFSRTMHRNRRVV